MESARFTAADASEHQACTRVSPFATSTVAVLFMKVLINIHTHMRTINNSLGTAALVAHTRMIQRPARAKRTEKPNAVPIVVHIVRRKVWRTQTMSPRSNASLKAGHSAGTKNDCTTAAYPTRRHATLYGATSAGPR